PSSWLISSLLRTNGGSARPAIGETPEFSTKRKPGRVLCLQPRHRPANARAPALSPTTVSKWTTSRGDDGRRSDASFRAHATAQIIGLRRLVPTSVRKSPVCRRRSDCYLALIGCRHVRDSNPCTQRGAATRRRAGARGRLCRGTILARTPCGEVGAAGYVRNELRGGGFH